MSKESKSISVPADIYDKIEERVKATDFGSVEEYVLFILEEVLKDEEEEEQAYTEADEAEVKKRLKALGYMD
jgi:Arc/MetJ-type ribon-helix-helix transcriptional regulator